ncbi:GMC family oxidoreductase [Zavarzinia aquatilis]|uniref:GMC family oxidoreductase n=1 Tax=Zavarzinia aquatilis TaxID=2211142 RepID=A0A317DZE1_9PROT|nr:choline dehydrogenase [Zavarzinia aquatilis]PWR18423.1 GMC family oxidoreductase [Zavarzinia aquatilis]
MEFDYVIVGGGSAGCVMANRLSADGRSKVCLIEAGTAKSSPLVRWPGMFGMNMLTHRYNWAFNSLPNPATGGRSHFLPRGKGLGGSSAINAMVYIRGDASDYDTWAQSGNRGWAYQDVLPYFRRAEDNARGADDFHGEGGPLHVSDTHYGYVPNLKFIEAAEQAGFPRNPDFNGAQFEGVGLYQFTIKDGRRWGVRQAYLEPARSRPNLTVLTDARVLKLAMDGRRATGVVVDRAGKRETIKAGREVIMAAGSFGTPQVLLLSGIGPAAELRAKGIGVVHDLPGVGRNLQEHPDVAAVYSSKLRDGFVMNGAGLMKMAGAGLSYMMGRRDNMLGRSVTQAGGFIKSDPSVDVPDLQLHFVPLVFVDHGRDTKAMGQHGLSLHACFLRPYSRGSVTLASPDPFDDPAIDIGLLSDERDVDRLIKGVKLCRRILQQPALAAHLDREMIPGVEVRSDAELGAAVRQHCEHVYHPVGTAKMGSDPMAVVGDDLKVHGIAGLRVVDASIMPTLVSGNTNAPTIMIAEKAADMILGRAALPREETRNVA